MPLGKCFRLKTPTLCIETVQGHKHALQVPQGEIVKVLSVLTEDKRMVEVLWGSKPLALFAEDLKDRGEEVHEAGAS